MWFLFCLVLALQYSLAEHAPRVVTSTFRVPLSKSTEEFSYHNVGEIPRPLYRLALLQDVFYFFN